MKGGLTMKAYNIGLFIKRSGRSNTSVRKISVVASVTNPPFPALNVENRNLLRGYWVFCYSVWESTKTSLRFCLSQKILRFPTCKRRLLPSIPKENTKKRQKKIRRLEQLVEPTDKITQQFILRCKALAYFPEDYPASRDLLLQALSLTLPDFDFDHISNYLLGIEEVKILNQLANSYSEAGDRRFAIHIYRQLFEDPQKQLLNTEAKVSLIIMLSYNYSRLLGLERRYEEEIEIATIGQQACIQYNKCRLLGGLLLNMLMHSTA